LRGGLLALLAAALFGVSTPLVQRFGVGVGAFSTAALLYAGAAAVGALSRRRIEREARVMRSDLPRLLAMAAFGAVVGPVALAWGLQRTSGTSASLMLTLEALFTAVLAWRLYRETMDGRVWTAMLLLLAGGVVLAMPLSRLLPRVASPPAGGGVRWGRVWVPLLVPMIATPLLLRLLPTHFLPILVGDYLAAHFALYGLVTAGCLFWMHRRGSGPAPSVRAGAFVAATSAVIAYGFLAVVWPINAFVTSFLPGPGRAILVLAMLGGTLPYFLADEWLTRGSAAARGAFAASKLAFLASLAIAVALDFERLFFLIIILPVIVPFFVVYGLFSAWSYRSTGHPLVAGIANGVAFAWAIGVTFPLLAG